MYQLKDIEIVVCGLGYVGLPLAVEFGKNIRTIGFDINENRIEELKKGIDRTLELKTDEMGASKLLNFTTNILRNSKPTVFIVTVPTPIDAYKKPDLKPLLSVSKSVGEVLKKGDIVIYESTVYPGCTEDDCVPVLEKYSGLKFNQDFYCGYSPERINPGDKKNTLTKILKITSGSTPEIADFVDQLYGSIIEAGYLQSSFIKSGGSSQIDRELPTRC